MDIIEDLQKLSQREAGGKLAVERFEYQAAWGLSRIINLYKTGADFAVWSCPIKTGQDQISV